MFPQRRAGSHQPPTYQGSSSQQVGITGSLRTVRERPGPARRIAGAGPFAVCSHASPGGVVIAIVHYRRVMGPALLLYPSPDGSPDD